MPPDPPIDGCELTPTELAFLNVSPLPKNSFLRHYLTILYSDFSNSASMRIGNRFLQHTHTKKSIFCASPKIDVFASPTIDFFTSRTIDFFRFTHNRFFKFTHNQFFRFTDNRIFRFTGVTVYIVPLTIMSPRTKFPSEICPPRTTFTRENCPLLSEKCPPFLAVMCSIQSILVKNLKILRTDSLKSLIEQSICALFRYLANLFCLINRD